MPLLPRDVGGGSGGGIEEAPLDGKLYGRRMARWDPVPTLLTLIYYRGPFATPDELRAAHPTDIPGAYAVVSSTSSIWIWNHDKWEDTGATQTQAGILDAPKDGNTYGRKDGDWVVVGTGTINEEEVILIIKNTQHNVLKGIQGGKVEDGQVTEAYHLTKEEWEKLPVRPSILAPANGATDINQVPQIVGSPYAHPHDTLMYMKHIQIAKTSDFAAPVYDKEEVSRNITFQVPLKPDNSPYLEQNTLYYVRIRYRDRKMRWSHWSAPSKFTTMQTFPQNVLVAPQMIIPSDGGEASAFNPLLAMSTPKIVGGVGEFDQADWQISTDEAFATTLYDAQGTSDLVTHIPHDVNLSVVQASDFYARGRQRMTNGQYTPWAHPVRFGLRPEFDEPIFGLRRIFSKKYGIPMLFNIDEAGEVVYIPKRYWDKHPLYLFPRQDIPLGQNNSGVNVVSEMAYVAPCWIKYRVYDNDDGDMVIDLWFSAQQKGGDGWMLHPAFKKSPNGFLYAVHPAYTYIINGKSMYASTGAQSGDVNQVYIDGLNRHTTGTAQGPWHFGTIYEYRLLMDLIAAETLSLKVKQDGSNDVSWRVFKKLFGYIYNSTCYGIRFQGGGQKITSVRLQHPIMSDAFTDIPLDLPVNASLNATEVLRGEHPAFGFDLALLGIVSAMGNAPSPFGANGINAGLYDVPSVPNISLLTPLAWGLYAVAGKQQNSGIAKNIRIAKWLE